MQGLTAQEQPPTRPKLFGGLQSGLQIFGGSQMKQQFNTLNKPSTSRQRRVSPPSSLRPVTVSPRSGMGQAKWGVESEAGQRALSLEAFGPIQTHVPPSEPASLELVPPTEESNELAPAWPFHERPIVFNDLSSIEFEARHREYLKAAEIIENLKDELEHGRTGPGGLKRVEAQLMLRTSQLGDTQTSVEKLQAEAERLQKDLAAMTQRAEESEKLVEQRGGRVFYLTMMMRRRDLRNAQLLAELEKRHKEFACQMLISQMRSRLARKLNAELEEERGA